MDEYTKRLNDVLVEQELSLGYRVKAVPQRIKAILADAHQDDPEINSFDYVRFSKLTPRQKAAAAEHVLLRYNEDLGSQNYKTTKELLDINITRGNWSADKDKRIEELTEQSTSEMRALYLSGFDQRENWIEELNTYCNAVTTTLDASEKSDEDKARIKNIFFRWLNYTQEDAEAYQEHAESQGKESYMPTADYVLLLENSVDEEMQDNLSSIDELKFKIQQLKDIVDLRREMNALIEERVKMLSNSVEARRDRVEQLAQVYYGTQRATEDGRPLGPLVNTFDKFWDVPDEVIEWLQIESYFFYEGIPEASRGFLEQWGFIPAEPASGSQQASDESPAPPTLKNDSSPAETMPASSTELVPAKN